MNVSMRLPSLLIFSRFFGSYVNWTVIEWVFLDKYTVFRFKIYDVANRSKGKSTQSEGSFLESIRPSYIKYMVFWLKENGLLTLTLRSFKFASLFKYTVFKLNVDGLST